MWMRRAVLVLTASIGLILIAACAAAAPAPAPSVPAINADGSQITETQQDLANAVTDKLVELGFVNLDSVKVTLEGPWAILKVEVAQIAEDGSVEGLPVGSLLVVDTAQTPDVEKLTSADVLTLTADGALAVSLTGLTDEVVAQVRASLENSAGWKLTYDQGRAEVKTSDGRLVASADESTGRNWQPGEVLVQAVSRDGDGWQWDPETNSWVGGAGTGGPIDATVKPESATATTAPATEESTPKPTATPAPPETATPQPAPTEEPTVAPTVVEQVDIDSPEHAQAMENVRRWLSGEMQVPDEWRLRKFAGGPLEPYSGRLTSVERNRSVEPTEGYSGIVLGCYQRPNEDVVIYIGFEDPNSQKRFIAPLRIGKDSTSIGVAWVDSLNNTSAGDNSDVYISLLPGDVGKKLRDMIGHQVNFSLIVSIEPFDQKIIDRTPKPYMDEIRKQLPESTVFDSAMYRMANESSYEDLTPEEKELFDLETGREVLPMTVQFNF